MWPRSHTSGLISGEWTRSRSSSLIGATSASVRSRASVRAAIASAWVSRALAAIALPMSRDCLMRFSAQAVAQVQRAFTFEQPAQAEWLQVWERGAAGDRVLGAAAGQLGGESQEQLVDRTLLEQAAEQHRAAFAEQDLDIVLSAQAAQHGCQ